MKNILVFVFFSCCFVYTLAAKWDALRVKFGNPNENGFAYMPRNTTEAEDRGFEPLDDQCTPADAMFRGYRYWKRNETTTILIYDKNGYIAGMQTAIPTDRLLPERQWHPSPKFLGTYILNETEYDQLTLTVYFVDPSIVCTGRTAEQFKDQGTGTDLYIQSGSDPTKSGYTMKIPKSQDAVKETMWGNGKCFYDMGQHFWYNMTKTMPCDNFFPYCLLYNRGELNAFCFALNVDTQPSFRYEHPSLPLIKDFMEPVPDCFYSDPTFQNSTTLHVYFTDHFEEDKC